MLTEQKIKDFGSSLSIKDYVSHNKINEIEKLIIDMTIFDPKNRINDIKVVIKEIDKLLGLSEEQKASEFAPTVFQYRILKYIKSFTYGKANFKQIYEYIIQFYDVDISVTKSLFVPSTMFMVDNRIKRNDFVDMLEKALSVLEKNKLIEFIDGCFKYIDNKKNNDFFSKYS